MPPIPYNPDRSTRLAGIKDVVHEYANLISAGHHSLIPRSGHLWGGHCDDAFLLGCRKMDDFLMKKQRSLNYDETKELDDILALDYLPPGSSITWSLPIWAKEWRSPMNKQLAHLSYKRDKSWDHTIWLPILVPEFKTAWNAFQAAITDQEFREAFADSIRAKQHHFIS